MTENDIYDSDRMRKRTTVEQINELFDMGSELEDALNQAVIEAGGVVIEDKDTYYTIITGST